MSTDIKQSGEAIERARADDLLRRLGLALNALQIGVWEHNLCTDEVIWDLRMRALYAIKCTETRLPSEIWTERIHKDDIVRAYAEFDAAVAACGEYDSEFRVVWPDGEIRHIRSRAHYYQNELGEPCLIGAEWDVTDYARLSEQLEQKARDMVHAAQHDPLTGLPNRRVLDERYSEICRACNSDPVAVLHLDLDNFKYINDTFGHAAGDEVLRVVGERLRTAAPPNALVARTGGDEFVLIWEDFGGEEDLIEVASRLHASLETPIAFGSNSISTALSIGVAWTFEGPEKPLLLNRSDLALYESKTNGRGQTILFDCALQARLSEKRTVLEDLKVGLAKGDILPHYQIQVCATTLEIVGLEALARWHHPSKGVLGPSHFLPAANEAGLMSDLDAAILRQVLADRADWCEQGIAPPRIAVNVSAARLNEPALMASLLFQNSSLKGISFELVETIFLDEAEDNVVECLNALRALGAEIEIDDFGSGHASLLGLIRIRPDRLKIDRNLTSDVTRSTEKRRIVKSIVDIAKAMKVEVVAEGVETEAQAKILKRLGCALFQGFYYGHPTSADLIVAILRERQRLEPTTLAANLIGSRS